MTARLAIAGLLAVAVIVVASVLQRRRRPAPPPRTAYPVPVQLDRADFPRPEAPWLVAYFWSRTCDSCEGMGPKVAALESAQVSTCALEAQDHRAIHHRYAIAAIPMVLIADGDGVVRASFVGAVSATDLWAALAEVRSAGRVAEPGGGPLQD